MILKTARITNFRAIEDSGEFSIDPLTCFVGENGAGKSAILEALYKLNPVEHGQGDFSIFDYPRKKYGEYKAQHKTHPATVVTTTWELEADDRELLEPMIGRTALDSVVVQVSKGYDNQSRMIVDLDEDAVAKNREKVADGSLNAALADLLMERLPKFVYVTGGSNVPGEVALDPPPPFAAADHAAPSCHMFQALMDLAGLSVDEIREMGHSEELIADLEAGAGRVNREVFSFWRDGEQLRIEFRCDVPRVDPASRGGRVFRTRIRDARHGFTLGIEQQSAGLAAFLSSVVGLAHIRRSHGDRLVILLDHPAGTMHAQTQHDLSRYITANRRPGETILFTTLSTFTMGDGSGSSIRTVEDARVREEIRFKKHIEPVVHRAVAAPEPPADPPVQAIAEPAAPAPTVVPPTVVPPTVVSPTVVPPTVVPPTVVSPTVVSPTVVPPPVVPLTVVPPTVEPPTVLPPPTLEPVVSLAPVAVSDPPPAFDGDLDLASHTLDAMLPPLTADALGRHDVHEPGANGVEALETEESWWNELSFLKRRDNN